MSVRAARAAEPTAAAFAYIPPAWERYVVVYHAFERDANTPEINTIEAQVTGARAALVPGLTGNGLRISQEAAKTNPLRLHSLAFSPHRPLTISLWFRVDEPMQLPTCLHLISVRGRGFISNFVRGKGQWCALKEPTFVFQVYHFPGITNHNGRWSGRAWFEPGDWHHALMTISNAADVSVYWDGELRCHYTVRGRAFREGDAALCELGPTWLYHPMTIDDVLVLDRAVDADEVRDYVISVHQLREASFPGGQMR